MTVAINTRIQKGLLVQSFCGTAEETEGSQASQSVAELGPWGGSGLRFSVPPLLKSRASIRDQLNQQEGVKSILRPEIRLPSALLHAGCGHAASVQEQRGRNACTEKWDKVQRHQTPDSYTVPPPPPPKHKYFNLPKPLQRNQPVL